MVQWLTVSDFHPVAFACPLLLAAWLFLDQGRLLPFALFTAAAIVLFMLRSSVATAALSVLALALSGLANSGPLAGSAWRGFAGEALTGFSWITMPIAFPVIALAQNDESAEGLREVTSRLVAMGAHVISSLKDSGTVALPVVEDVHPALAPLCQIQSFYMAAWRLALARGLDPDAPEHLRKVTETV